VGSVTEGDRCGEVDPWDFSRDVTKLQTYLDKLHKWVPTASNRRRSQREITKHILLPND